MKKNLYLIFIILLVTSFRLNAQLKVVGTSPNAGSVSIGYTGYANIWLGNQPNSIQYNGFNTGKWGFEVWGENLNIWKPWPSPNNGTINYYMFLTPSGAIGVGQVPTHSGICLDVNGKVYSYGIELTSDERLKKDIQPLTSQTNKLYQLNGKSYTKKSKEDEVALPDITDEKGNIIKKYEKAANKKSNEIKEFGFIAQELKDVYPELVSQDTLGYYYVNYIGLIPVLVEAMKEQKMELDSLKSLINDNSETSSQKVRANQTNKTSKSEILTYPALKQNIPNPFNSTTIINYYLPETVSTANIYIYDMNGTQLKHYPIIEKGKGKGKGNILIQGSEFNAGMYLYTLITDGEVIDTKRMILTE